MTPPFYDMHVHLDLSDDPRTLAQGLIDQGLGGCFSCTVRPEGYQRAQELLGDIPGVRVGLGLHPWWVDDGSVDEQSVELFEALAPNAHFIGEIGVDLTKRHASSIELQRQVLRRCLKACSREGTLLSFHSSHAAGVLLDILEELGYPGNTRCILHWFNGTSEDLARAVRMGCYFSCNLWMLNTRRGRAYARSLPVKQLLIETDCPSEREGITTPPAFMKTLNDTLATLEELRGEPLGEQIAATSARLLGL